jgi:hypothetical protein
MAIAAQDDTVRPFQLPQNANPTAAVDEYNLASQLPVMVTPGANGQAPISIPPVQLGSGSYSITITFYMPQSAVEEIQAEQ